MFYVINQVIIEQLLPHPQTDELVFYKKNCTHQLLPFTVLSTWGFLFFISTWWNISDFFLDGRQIMSTPRAGG